MNLAIGKRGKLWLLAGVPMVLCMVFIVALSFQMPFARSTPEEEAEKLQPDMTVDDVKVLLQKNLIYSGPVGGNKLCIRFEEPNSVLFPTGGVTVTFNPSGRIKEIETVSFSKDANNIWYHWKRQLGL